VADRLDGSVTRLSASGVTRGIVHVGRGLDAIAFGGGAVWAAGTAGEVARIDPTGRVTIRYDLHSPVRGLGFANGRLWVAVQGGLERHKGGVLRVVTDGAPIAFDPAASEASSGWSRSVLGLTNDGLVGFRRVGGPQGATVVPDLAESFDEPDPTTYTFTLRQDLHYSDGSPVSVKDFRYAFSRLFRVNPEAATLYDHIVGAKKCQTQLLHTCHLSKGIRVDRRLRTVTFRLSEADPDFAHKLALPYADPVPTTVPLHLVQQPGVIPAIGPYMFSPRSTRADPILVRNPEFREWSADAQPSGYPNQIALHVGLASAGKVERSATGGGGRLVHVEAVPGGESKMNALQNAAHDTLHIFRLPELWYAFLVMPSTGGTYFALNSNARQALSVAIDRQAISRLFGRRAAESACAVLAVGLPSSGDNCAPVGPEAVRPNIKRADVLVGESGVRALGAPPLSVYTWGEAQPIANAVKRAASILPTAVTVHSIPFPQYYTTVAGPNVELGIAADRQAYPSTARFLQPYLSCHGHDNLARFCMSGLDRAMRNAAQAGSLALSNQTVLLPKDTGRLSHDWAVINHKISAEYPWIPLVSPNWVDATTPSVGNYQYNPVVGPLLDQMWVN